MKVAALFCFVSATAMAQVPTTVPFEAVLTDTTGNPLSGGHTIEIALYDASTAGTELGVVYGGSVTLGADGYFTVDLDLSSLDISAGQLHAELTLDGEILTPRFAIGSVPYALVAASVGDHTHDADDIGSGTIDASRLDADLQDLMDGTLSGSKIGSGIDAANITVGQLSAMQMPSDTPHSCVWRVSSDNTQSVTATCGSGTSMVSGFCYTNDAGLGVSWYRPLGLSSLCNGTSCSDAEFSATSGTSMYCVFSGTTTDYKNKAFAFCCGVN